MKLEKLIDQLNSFEPTKYPFLSIYLNAEPNQHGRDDFDVFLKKQLSMHRDNYEEHTPERESFDRDVERITNYINQIDPSADGVAIFSCSGADFFAAKEFNVPFKDDEFYVFNRPHIFPLARLREQNPKYAVVIADTNDARIYIFKRKRALETEEIENFKTHRTDQGGWSQKRFQRHIDNFHKKHAKEVIDELDKTVRDENIKQIVLVGDETVIIPLLKDELTPFLEEKIVGTLRLNVDTPEHELVEETEKAVNAHDALEDKKKIDRLMDQHYKEGLGITGVKKTFAALANGQVNELYINADFDTIEYDEDDVAEVLKAYAPGIDEKLPAADRARLLIDELIRLGLDSAETVRFIEDEHLLKEEGGIGALLRYRAEGDIVNSAAM